MYSFLCIWQIFKVFLSHYDFRSPPSIRLFSLSSWALHFCLKQQILLLWVCYPWFNAKHATAVIRSGKLHWIKAYNHNQNYYVLYIKSIHIFYTTLHHPHINSPNCVKQKKGKKYKSCGRSKLTNPCLWLNIVAPRNKWGVS